MTRPGMRQDQAFWQIVKDLKWKLDDGRWGPPPADEPEFGHGARRALLPLALGTHLVAFLLGALTVALLVIAVT